MKKHFTLLSMTILLSVILQGQDLLINQRISETDWDAEWISHPEADNNQQGIFLFKRIVNIESLPEEFIINISADNRYKLYINKKFICLGPAKGDAKKYRYETLDIASFLKQGINTICVKVWNFGSVSPVAICTKRTGLIIQGESQGSDIINTGNQWKVLRDTSCKFVKNNNIGGYYAAGPAEIFNGLYYPWDWQEPDFSSSLWKEVREEGKGQTIKSVGKYGHPLRQLLYPRDIAGLEYKAVELGKIRKVIGMNPKNAESLFSTKDSFLIPANHKVSILIDNEALTNGYPQLRYSKGKNSKIKLTYAESLFYTEIINGNKSISNKKGNRNEIKDKEIKGNYDQIICDGGKDRYFEPLWWRCFRYIQLDIETGSEDLYIKDFHNLFAAYPFKEKASFKTDDPVFDSIWNTGWRTQRLCAGETYFDCPYYEQLQYIGDTRIQGLITYYISGDTLLWRKAINDFYDSRHAIGITQSRYPSNIPQYIPTFSLIWITMLHDYLMHCQDEEFIQRKLIAVLDILQWFENRLEENALPGKLEYWTFVDWVKTAGWDAGVPPLMEGKSSALIAMQYLYTLKKADVLFGHFGMKDYQDKYRKISDRIGKSLKESCWNESRGLFADTPAQKNFSQHTNVLAILADIAPEKQQEAMIQKILDDPSLAQCSYYFTFYLTKALKKSGKQELYFNILSKWEKAIRMGLSTFPEDNPVYTRSDCHAWSASPLYFMFSLICGIEPVSPGFMDINISPEFGNLKTINAVFPHFKGDITLNLEKKGSKLTGNIDIPKDLNVTLEWNSSLIKLSEGINPVELK